MKNLSNSEIYSPLDIEEKWIKKWNKDKINSLRSDSKRSKGKYYVLEMFPYPSGEPHMGHARNYTIGDVVARIMSGKGYDVLHPIGYDAFGLPAENAAIKEKIHPKDSTIANIDKMKRALKRMGMTYQFENEIITSNPEYYKWTQWFFLLFYKMGLAEKKEAPVNWCSSCQTVLANEQVVSGKCERCESQVEKRVLSQWFFKITKYAQRLLDDMELLGGWPERVLTIQRNWIGRSEGAQIDFKLAGNNGGITIPVFTTRPDTLYGATFFILASEHPLVNRIVTDSKYSREVKKIRSIISNQSDIERSSVEAEKVGCFTGRYIVNPVNGQKIPIWVANYVLLEYGTGAIMAVPAHDERDFDFASKYNIQIKEVISPDGKDHGRLKKAYTGEGIMINSGPFNGLSSKKGRDKVTSYLEEKKAGKFDVNYKIKDWLISRQRYWGTPIPIIYCNRCGIVPVPEKDLPVLLPYDVDFKPTGLSPLAYSKEFVNTKCPKCGENAKRETDTMDTFVCSSWYFLRYCSPYNDSEAFDRSEVDYWMPVDQYIGGIEHATMHLIYSRFFTKVLYDSKLIKFKEPFIKYYPHGIVNLDGKKMSKSKGNIVNPSEIYNKFGADVLRLYILFIGPADSIVEWSDSGLEGASRFLKRFWKLVKRNIDFISRKSNNISKSLSTEDILSENVSELFNKDKLNELGKKLFRKLHQTIKKVTIDTLKRFNFNTAISAIMELVNLMYKYNDELSDDNKDAALVKELTRKLLVLFSPICPFITEELWLQMKGSGSIHRQPWPDYDARIAIEELVTIVFQVNGKLRDKIELPLGTPEEEIKSYALQSERVKKFTDGKEIIKKIVVPNKLINIVVKN